MKRLFGITIFILFALFLVACDFGIYTVDFYDYDGTFIEGYYYTKGSELDVPKDPKRKGYNFAGWTPSLELIVTRSVEYTATYIEKIAGESDTISFHFIDLQNKMNGDSIYIKAGDTDILIDAGARQGSASVIEAYVDQYCDDNTLEYVIATHADQDHIAAFVGTQKIPGIFSYYTCQTLIDFPLTNKDTEILHKYQECRDEEVKNGAVHYTALQCYNETDGAKRVYEIGEGLEMEILYNYYYENTSSDENEYSVCILFSDTNNEQYFLFTGDLEGKGEKKLAELYDLPEVELFKAGHHGSPTSSTEELLSEIKPKVCVVSCVAGAAEYTDNVDNIFPSTTFINHISKYTSNVYCTSQLKDGEYAPLNGSVVVTFTNGTQSIECTASQTLLKDSEWFNSKVKYVLNGENHILAKEGDTDVQERTWRIWPN